MTKLPAFTAREVIKKLKKTGFVFDRQAKGSHEIWYNPTTKRRTTIPNHPGVDIPKGTLRAIIKEAGLTEEEFVAL
jgi:predicted RNA binding protein YcfA (HicA-like mRNA interferase family)